MPDLNSGLPLQFPAPKPPVTMRALDDAGALRNSIYSKVLETTQGIPPMVGKTHTLQMRDIHYADPDIATLAEQKQARLAGTTLGRRLRGTWELLDNLTGKPIDNRVATLAVVPKLLDDGTYIYNGTIYTLANQLRLRAGSYAQERENGELATHINVVPGKGYSHHLNLDPATGVFRVSFGQSHIPLIGLLRALGVSERQLHDSLAEDIGHDKASQLVAANITADRGTALGRLHEKLGRGGGEGDDDDSRRTTIAKAIREMQVDPEVMQDVLGQSFDKLDSPVYLAAAKKLLAISSGKAKPDDRDAMAYQQVLGPEDLFSERMAGTRHGIKSLLRNLLWKSATRKSLKHIPSGVFSAPLQGALLESGLGSPSESINPLMLLDQRFRSSRMGQGGISNPDSIPDDSRSVHPSQFGFIDLVTTPESSRTGVDLRLAQHVKKGSDGRIYAPFKNTRTGQLEYLSPQMVAKLTVGFPSSLKSGRANALAFRNGKLVRAKRRDIQYVLPHFEKAFAPISNLVPLKSGMKQQRASMAQRMLTQALSMAGGEAPLVQSGVPDEPGTSYEQRFAHFLGAVRAGRDGTVIEATPDFIRIAHPDGTESRQDLATHYPYSRKSYLHQSAAVRPGQSVRAGDLLATSNYTDAKGTAALGLNARVAYIPDRGHNFEDAISVSQDFANRARSLHMYQHQLEKSDEIHADKNKFISLFPTKYPPKLIKAFDDHGVIQPGTTVNEGDPLILAVRHKPISMNSLHGGRQSSFVDASETWEHHTPGVVTDVLHTDKGISVLVKTEMPMQVGDKMSGRYGDKGVISRIIPMHEMPKDEQGRPYEVLLNPLGIVTRANPSQVIEAVLGKIAEKRGEHYSVPDFEDIKDLRQYAEDESLKHGVKSYDSIYDPELGEIKNVLTGNRFMMKLHHTAESKGQSRDTAGYTNEGAPAKGGPTGAKRISLLDSSALLSHGASHVVEDAHKVRGQRNVDYWRQVMSGNEAPPTPIPDTFKKYVSSLKASGINVVQDGPRIHFMALTNKDVDELAGDRDIENAETVDWRDRLNPVKGGLFDQGLTGGHSGCFHPSVLIWTEFGQMPIGKLVRSKTKIRVWSYDFECSRFVLKPVTNWFRNQSAEGIGHAEFKSYGRVNVTQPRFDTTALWGTRGHQVYAIDGSKQSLADTATLTTVFEKITYTQSQLLWGGLLGDTHITRAGYMTICHGIAQKKYAEFKIDILGAFVKRQPEIWIDRSGGAVREKIRFDTCAHLTFRQARQLCYPDNEKQVSQQWLDKIDEMGLAFWVMDDGHCHRAKDKNTTYVTLATHGFTYRSIELLRTWLATKWSLQTFTTRNCEKYGDRDCGWSIDMAGCHAERLFDLIAPYLPQCMQYKLPGKPHTKCCKTCRQIVKPRRDFCDNCLLQQARDSGTSKIGRGIRRRLGGTTAVVRAKLAANYVLIEDTGCDRWSARDALAGTAVKQMQQDNKIVYDLQEITCQWKWKTGKPWEKVQTVYDIEVADTHNYFANGVLVSNSKWSSIKLHTPLPSPAFEDPICRLLGITHPMFEAIISGQKPLKGKTGMPAMIDALNNLDLDTEIAKARGEIAGGKKTYRDGAIKRLAYLKDAKRLGIHPKDWILNRVPVMPPRFRPVSVMGSKKLPMVSDINYLYKELFDANQALSQLADKTADTGDEQLSVYKSFKAITGLGEPQQPKNQERQVSGLIKQVIGNSPKYSTVQFKLIGTTTDLVGRGAVVPDADLSLDEIGIPEKQAWTIYQPYIIRRLVRSGLQPVQAARQVLQQTESAKQALAKELTERPIIANRAPVLHRFGIMAFWPKLVKDDSIHTNTLINAGFNLDHDGDAMQLHVPASKGAVQDAIEKMLPSKNLFAPGTFKVHQLPSKEYVGGLYTATAATDNSKPALRFETTADVIRAHQRGEIAADRRVQVMEHD